MMHIDNYAEAILLKEKMEQNLPIKVYFSKRAAKQQTERNPEFDSDRAYNVEKVMYAGDDGGITCVLESDSAAKEVFAISVTHLKIDPNHPLAEEIQAYQQKRIHRLALANRSGFAAELLAKELINKPKRKKGKGFSR